MSPSGVAHNIIKRLRNARIRRKATAMNKLYVICEVPTEVKLVENLLFDRLSRTYNIIIPITLPKAAVTCEGFG